MKQPDYSDKIKHLLGNLQAQPPGPSGGERGTQQEGNIGSAGGDTLSLVRGTAWGRVSWGGTGHGGGCWQLGLCP